MRHLEKTLAQIGLTEKETATYLILLGAGPASVRKIAEFSGINRGTTHECLKSLQRHGLVSYYHKAKNKHFVAEDPNVIETLVQARKLELEALKSNLEKTIPELRSLWNQKEERPLVKYYENTDGIRTVLYEILQTTEAADKKEYAAYSSADIKSYIYRAYPAFTENRIKKGITMRAISIGPGGETKGLDERRWLTKEESAPTYTFLYSGKIAMVSVGQKGAPHGLIIEDENLYRTELLIFNHLWETLTRTHLKNGFVGENERISSQSRRPPGAMHTHKYAEPREGGFAEIRRLQPKCIFEMGSK